MLNNFESGWKDTFTPYLNYVLELFPSATIERIDRYKGMLRIKMLGSTPNEQYVLDGVCHKIERDSVRMCEHCGKHGFRRFDEHLPAIKCLCFACYVHEVDSILNNNL
jgi:hypothetical protein